MVGILYFGFTIRLSYCCFLFHSSLKFKKKKINWFGFKLVLFFIFLYFLNIFVWG
jgi:hypothetical protein